MEFSGFDTHINPRRIGALTHGFNGYFHQWHDHENKKEWSGFRPMTMDGLPFIDRSPRLKNVMIAAGHNMIGMSAAPGTGKLVADIMTGSSPHIDAHPYRIARHHK
jgi:D-amino-acid dehydrogenase